MIEELTLYARVILSILFLSAAVSKLMHFDKHVGVVQDYQIVPERFVRLFSQLEVAAEIAVGMMLWVGLLPGLAALGATGLLVMYGIAISINLLRGRTEVSCGCGGAAGSHQLSWWLVLRNALLLGIGMWLWNTNSRYATVQALIEGSAFDEAFDVMVIPVMMMAMISMVVYTLVNEWQTMVSRGRQLLGREDKRWMPFI